MLLFVDNLTNVDFSYLDSDRGLLGETWLASTELDGALDDQGMVCDFGIVKRTLRDWLDATLDHCLLVPRHSKNLDILEEGDTIHIRWRFGDQQVLSCRSPAQAITLIDAEVITAETVANWSIQQLKSLLPDSVQKLDLQFAEEAMGTAAFYHYSHGLKKHDGNCQRISHGHRSRIEIWQDGLRAPQLEAVWSQRWCDIYLGSEEDLIKSPTNADQGDSGDQYHFAYQSQQGAFELSLPKSCCELMTTDTTVEWIARFIAEQLKKQQSDDTSVIKVKAFEGIGKGAVYQV